MKGNLKQLFVGIVCVLFFGSIIGTMLYQHTQYQSARNIFTSIKVEEVRAFHIYPRTTIPVGRPVQFELSDPLITEFLRARTDLRPYWPSRDTLASVDQQWRVEIFLRDKMSTIRCYIPSDKGKFVVGRFDNNEYGAFQSIHLYQWYQTYHARWLTSSTQ